MSTLEIVTLMNTLDATVIEAVRQALPQIAETAEEAARRIAVGGRLFYVGAGTSGRPGVLDASECPPTFGVSPKQLLGLWREVTLRSAMQLRTRKMMPHWVNRTCGIRLFAVRMWWWPSPPAARHNIVLARFNMPPRSTHFRWQYVVTAVRFFRVMRGLRLRCPPGAEVLSGSTRLRAGTATKLALNMISTAAMVRLGKAYGNLMVDVQPSNVKLRNRAVRIVMKACKLTEPEAEALLRTAGGNQKRAIVMKLAGTTADAAEYALEQTGGFVRAAVAKIKKRVRLRAEYGKYLEIGSCGKRFFLYNK